MKSIKLLFSFLAILFLSYHSFAQQTRLLSQPALSDSHIAFVYAEDLWVADKNGNNPKRLTIDIGVESNPVFSPDGQTIAFNGQYDGNTDVYTVPVTGGVPKRLTWHPYPDMVRDFTPDGKKVLFNSQRTSFTGRYLQLYTVSINGGAITQLEIPNAFWATYNPSGDKIAYTPLYEAFNQWKHYRGGMETRIWIYDTKTKDVVEIPKPAGGSNDTKPQWVGNDIYFRSDRDGEFNLYKYDSASKQVTALTNYKDFPVLDMYAHGNTIIFEQAGYLHTYNTATDASSKINITIATDLLERRERYVSGKNYVRSATISPSGARVVVDFRGDIVTIPSEKGDPNNITETQGIHEQFPAWSPDGKSIAYFSDESGEYALHIQAIDDGSVKKLKLNGAGFYAYPHWSPDSKNIAFVDNSRSIFLAEISSETITKIASDEMYTPGIYRELFGDWSHDSNWIAYTTLNQSNFEQAYLYSVSEKKSYAVTDGFSTVTNPVFDPSGKYLYMLSSTDSGPVVNWFDQSNNDTELSFSMYLVTLQKEVTSPFAKENDIEAIEKAEEKEKEKEDSKKGKKDAEEEATKPLKIDWEGLQHRIIDIPVPAGQYGNLSVPKEGELYYISYSNEKATLHKYTLKEREDKEIMPADNFIIAAKGDKMLFQKEGSYGVTETGKKPEKGDGMLNVAAIQVKIDPVAEWENIFDEAWRVNRDYFYDPGMHGVDWEAMKVKYKQFLPDVTTRSDLYTVMQWMFSELSVGHHRFSSTGDDLHDPESINGGLLGADFIQKNNRYQIAKIYGGLNWNPDLRSPLTEPGVLVNEGDYIIKVDGKEVTAADNIYRFFENKADKIVALTVSDNANGNNPKTYKVTPVGSERDLRNRAWVEGNLKKVAEATNGQVGYVYVPNTAGAGHEYFKRYFYPQATKKAMIVDERFNGGGQLADYYIDLLKKPEQAYWNFRYGKDLKSPSASIQGPKVLITDETAGSGGDYFPWMFRKFNVGTIIGKRTWGGLVGVLGYPEFIDGGIVTAPNVAFYTENGYRVENEGVAPDIMVEQWPKDVIAGKDPQLEKAIEVVLQQLKENPPKKMERPAYPIKTKN